MADELVGEKLAKYADDKKTELSIINFGRYWMVHGGFLIYLKEGEKKIKADKDRHSEQRK
jgi:predicted type IV restriction endonuclease